MNKQEWNDLLDKWSRVGAAAAHQDTWMEPCYEEDTGGRAIDLPDLMLAHRQQWETTDHFRIRYGHEMAQDIVDVLWGVGQAPDWGAEYEAKQDLLDAFWDAWESAQGAYELARKAMETA